LSSRGIEDTSGRTAERDTPVIRSNLTERDFPSRQYIEKYRDSLDWTTPTLSPTLLSGIPLVFALIPSLGYHTKIPIATGYAPFFLIPRFLLDSHATRQTFLAKIFHSTIV
jgi:hypothetical protein